MWLGIFDSGADVVVSDYHLTNIFDTCRAPGTPRPGWMIVRRPPTPEHRDWPNEQLGDVSALDCAARHNAKLKAFPI
jgi:hypothetical protein